MATSSYDYLRGKSTKNPQFDELLEVFDFRFDDRSGRVDEERGFREVW